MQSALHHTLPYIVNFSILVLGLVVATRKPLQRFVYQRYERIKDATESAQRDRLVTDARLKKIELATAAFDRDALALREREGLAAKSDVAAVVERTKQELARIQDDAQTIVANESRDRLQEMRGAYVDLVLANTEAKLRSGLKGEDHSGLIKRAARKIEANA
jgi:F0F1-type ATP synthase membrane subunit b/b'